MRRVFSILAQVICGTGKAYEDCHLSRTGRTEGAEACGAIFHGSLHVSVVKIVAYTPWSNRPYVLTSDVTSYFVYLAQRALPSSGVIPCRLRATIAWNLLGLANRCCVSHAEGAADAEGVYGWAPQRLRRYFGRSLPTSDFMLPTSYFLLPDGCMLQYW